MDSSKRHTTDLYICGSNLFGQLSKLLDIQFSENQTRSTKFLPVSKSALKNIILNGTDQQGTGTVADDSSVMEPSAGYTEHVIEVEYSKSMDILTGKTGSLGKHKMAELQDGQNKLGSTAVKAKVSRLQEQSVDIPKEENSFLADIKIKPFWHSVVFIGKQGTSISGFVNGKENQLAHVTGLKDFSSNDKAMYGIDSERHLVVWNGTDISSPPQQVTIQEGWGECINIHAGDAKGVALTNSGKVGEIIKEGCHHVFRPLVLRGQIIQLTCGKEHVIARTKIGLLFSWGSGSRGQLGHGGTESTKTPKVLEALEGLIMIHVDAGGWHSASVSDEGDLYTWGWNESGQLGFPSSTLRWKTAKEHTSEDHKEKIPELVNVQLTPHCVDFPNCSLDEVSVVAAACGARHTAAVTGEGSLYTWGCNEQGQLGQGDTVSRDTPTKVLQFCQMGKSVSGISCGAWNTVIWTKDNTLNKIK